MSTTSGSLLPKQFAALEGYLHFALPTAKERLRNRVHSTMPDLEAFYAAMKPHMEAIMTYLQNFPPFEKDLEPEVQRLVRLAKAFMDVSVAVELFHAPDEPNVWSFEDMVLEDQ